MCTARNNVTVTIRITVNCGILQCGGIDMYAISPYVDSCHFITVPARPDASPDAYVYFLPAQYDARDE